MPIAAGLADSDQSRDSQQTGGSGASPSTLAGVSDMDPQGAGQASSQTDEGLKQAVQTVRQIQVQVMDLARQFPAAASSLRASANGLRAALRQIIANPGSPEPPAPAIGG